MHICIGTGHICAVTDTRCDTQDGKLVGTSIQRFASASDFFRSNDESSDMAASAPTPLLTWM